MNCESKGEWIVGIMSECKGGSWLAQSMSGESVDEEVGKCLGDCTMDA
jgi:hypothetical protein